MFVSEVHLCMDVRAVRTPLVGSRSEHLFFELNLRVTQREIETTIRTHPPNPVLILKFRVLATQLCMHDSGWFVITNSTTREA